MHPAARLLALALLAAPVAAQDVVAEAIEAALAPADEPELGFLVKQQSAVELARAALPGSGRCVVDVGDANGDGRADLAVGVGPDAGDGPTLAVLDGGTAAVLWSARPGFGYVRGLRALDVDDGRLAVGTASREGRVEVRSVATGDGLWGRNLVPAGPELATVNTVRWVDDLDGDGARDLLVAGGGRLLAAWALSGADGSVLWTHAAGEPVEDVLPVPDRDGDGRPEVLAVGGVANPFARLLASADGLPLWDVPLDGPGSAGLALDDVDGDGTDDVAVGQFAEPASCVIALSGADGGRLWSSSVDRNVTALALTEDTSGTGLRDLVVGSFDNAVSCLLALNGLRLWRREVSVINGGSTLDVAVSTDLEGNGAIDVVAGSLDHRLYLHGGHIGQLMANYDARGKAVAVDVLADRTGDGRPEMLITGKGYVAVLDGAAGTATGPNIEFMAFPVQLNAFVSLFVWSYPTTTMTLWGSLGTGSFQPSGVVGVFGLDPDHLVQLFSGPVPGVGGTALSFPPLGRDALGIDIHLQALATYQNGLMILSPVATFQVVE